MKLSRLKKHCTIALAIALVSGASDVRAQCPSDACVACVDIALPGLEAAVDAAFAALEQGQELLDQAIEVGRQSEVVAINLYEQDVVGALMALSGEVGTETATASEIEARMYEAIKNKMEQLEKTDLAARQNLYAAQNYGFDNVAYASKLFLSGQKSLVLDEDGQETEYAADVKYLLGQVSRRTRDYTRALVRPDAGETGEDALSLLGVYESTVSGGLWEAVVDKGDIPESLAARRYVVSPPGIQQAMRAVDAQGNENLGYWRIAGRVRAAAEFMAWDLALRSEISTEKGATSLLHTLRSWTDDLLYNTEAISDGANADKRELLNAIAANMALSNLLDLLTVEAGSYQVALESAKVGFNHDTAINPIDGYIDITSLQTGNVRRAQ